MAAYYPWNSPSLTSERKNSLVENSSRSVEPKNSLQVEPINLVKRELPVEPKKLDADSKILSTVFSTDIKEIIQTNTADLFSNDDLDLLDASFDDDLVGQKVNVSEFDPFVSKDWMMKFESPLAVPIAAEPVPTPQQQPISLLDQFEPISPSSQLKYSQNDFNQFEENFQKKHEKEFSVALMEIQELMKKVADLESENKKVTQTLAQWEYAVKVMITEREDERNTAKDLLAAKQAKCQELETQNDAQRSKYNQLRLENADLKESFENLSKRSIDMEAQLQTSNQRYDALKTHAETKLNAANVEIAKVRAAFDKDLSALKAKSSRADIQILSLERNLQAKIQENAELSQICDGLVSQIEKLG